VRERYVAAFALRVGNFFRTVSLDPDLDFLPPEERFYAGGATSVRGFDRNALGPGVYVTSEVKINADGDTVPVDDNAQFVATGGTALLIVSAELRMPSPFLRDRLRLVGFVDGGSIGTGALWDVGLLDMKFAPGLGLRLQTPVGPARLDIAYNPHRRPAAPLLLNDLQSDVLRRVNDVYRPPSAGFFGRLRFHLGIGHAF
jgi:outer membrane protein assembly factor BamA